MTVNKDKKVKRYRGSKTHGCGSMKKRRGAGNRGGRGNAGSGKRGDANKQSFIKTRYFGKHGFKKKGVSAPEKTIKLFELEKLEHAEKGVLDLGKLGYTKLLANGNITKKLNIKIPYATKSAIDKVNAAGGKVETLEGSVSGSAKPTESEE